jgi:hypothetical protein
VVVKVTADAEVAGVFQLRARVSNAGEGQSRLFPAAAGAQPIVFDTSFSLTVPRARTGALDIAVDGLDDGGAAIANGAGTVDLRVGDNVTVTIMLQAGASLCGNGRVDDGETCDDGDRLSNGDCNYLCQTGSSGPGAGGNGGAAGTGGNGGGAGTGGGSAGAGGGPCTIELLTSGNFDGSNTRWTQVTRSRALIYDQMSVPTFVPAPHTPTRLAWLGYDAVSDMPALRQSVQVPANAVQVNISGYYQIQTDESGCQCDKAFVEIERPSPGADGGVMTTKLTEWNNENHNDSWAFFSTFVNGAAVAGQTITFQLRAEMDDGVNTSFYFDTLTVSADVCP